MLHMLDHLADRRYASSKACREQQRKETEIGIKKEQKPQLFWPLRRNNTSLESLSSLDQQAQSDTEEPQH